MIQQLLPGSPCPLLSAVTTTGQLLIDDSPPVDVAHVRIAQYKPESRGQLRPGKLLSSIGGFQHLLGALRGPHYLQGVRWCALPGGGRVLQLWVSRGDADAEAKEEAVGGAMELEEQDEARGGEQQPDRPHGSCLQDEANVRKQLEQEQQQQLRQQQQRQQQQQQQRQQQNKPEPGDKEGAFQPQDTSNLRGSRNAGSCWMIVVSCCQLARLPVAQLQLNNRLGLCGLSSYADLHLKGLLVACWLHHATQASSCIECVLVRPAA